ncbi:MAG: EamA family transporter [Anaerofustis sp.]
MKKSFFLYAVLAALLFGISTPLSKLLIHTIPPAFLASFLYLGAGLGMGILFLIQKSNGRTRLEASVNKNDLPEISAMILLDIAAPILLMYAVAGTTSSNVSLLSNFEIVATSFIAFFIFKEGIGKRMWYAIVLITLGCLILSFEDTSSLSFSVGSILVLLACICWGFENNLTKKLSYRNPVQIVMIKGLGSGFGAWIIALIVSDYQWNMLYALLGMLLGFSSYGLSIYFYIKAQRVLGASLTSAYYAASPFIGAILSLLLLHETINWAFAVALLVMLGGTYIAVSDRHSHVHTHQPITHEHRHTHDDSHHFHTHGGMCCEHSHIHTHMLLEHDHAHLPDLQHSHTHSKRRFQK